MIEASATPGGRQLTQPSPPFYVLIRNGRVFSFAFSLFHFPLSLPLT
jgi:hypothetical protein